MVNWYCANVRPHNEAQLLGVIRQIQNMLARGEVTAAETAQAIRNYAGHRKTKETPEQFRYTIKKFIRESMVKEWLNPTIADPVVRKLAEIAEAPRPVVETVPVALAYDEDEAPANPEEDMLLADLND